MLSITKTIFDCIQKKQLICYDLVQTMSEKRLSKKVMRSINRKTGRPKNKIKECKRSHDDNFNNRASWQLSIGHLKKNVISILSVLISPKLKYLLPNRQKIIKINIFLRSNKYLLSASLKEFTATFSILTPICMSIKWYVFLS